MYPVETIQDYFEDKLSNIEFILLYGSYARGEAHGMSDIDIAIYFKDSPSLLTIGGYITDLEMQLHKKIEINTLNNLYKSHPLLAYNITTDHQPIIITNQEKYVEFKRRSMLYYFDAKPLIEQNMEAFKRRIKDGKIGERNYV